MARNVLAENASVTRAQQISIYFSGWASLFLAIVGGSYAAESWPGDFVSGVIGFVPWDAFPNVLLVLGFIGWAYDILNDLTPNYTSVIYSILGPAIAVAADGNLASRISDWSNALQGSVGGDISAWVGNLGASGLAIVCCGAAVAIAKRTLAKQAQAAAAQRAGGGR